MIAYVKAWGTLRILGYPSSSSSYCSSSSSSSSTSGGGSSNGSSSSSGSSSNDSGNSSSSSSSVVIVQARDLRIFLHGFDTVVPCGGVFKCRYAAVS